VCKNTHLGKFAHFFKCCLLWICLFSLFLETLEKFNLPQAFFGFGEGFVASEPLAGFFGKDDIKSFDFLYHFDYYNWYKPYNHYTMKTAKYFAFIAVIIIAGIAFFLFLKKPATAPTQQSQMASPKQLTTNNNNMKITSPAFSNDGSIPQKYTCDKTGASPELIFSEVPEGTKSLALIMHDPDAPISGGFTHWVVFNMSPATGGIKENAKPESGIEGINSSGKIGYTSPCPPSGVHHYQFMLYALDIDLNLDSSAKKTDIEKAMEGHILGQAELVGLYQRK